MVNMVNMVNMAANEISWQIMVTDLHNKRKETTLKFMFMCVCVCVLIGIVGYRQT